MYFIVLKMYSAISNDILSPAMNHYMSHNKLYYQDYE